MIRFLKRKYAKTDELENLYQFTLRGVLGYLMKRVENCNLAIAKKERLKIFVINILKIHKIRILLYRLNMINTLKII